MNQPPQQLDNAADGLSPCKAAALDFYRIASLPVRRFLANKQARVCRSRVMSFFYHRVAARADSPWTAPMTVFRQQMDWLCEQFEMVTLDESCDRIRFGNTRPCVHITFDDGYAENCSQALPYLISNGIPVTYFVASQHVISGHPFKHDVQLGQPMAVNTPAQIRAMADAGVEIGSHTRNHVDLAEVTDEVTLRDELIGSKHELEDMIGRPVRYFAFPYGLSKQITPAAVRILREAGYEAICSAFGGYNFPGADPFHVQRIHGDNEMSRFKNWATMDPRKTRIRLELPLEATQPCVA